MLDRCNKNQERISYVRYKERATQLSNVLEMEGRVKKDCGTMTNRKYPLNLLTDYFIDNNNINQNTNYEIEEIPAINLIRPSRFDIMAKWIFIDAVERGLDNSFAKAIYEDNIRAFSRGTYTEPGNEDKNSLDKYFKEFCNIIYDMKANGFDSSKSIIPVGKDRELFDGSHRVSAAAYYGKKVSVVRFPDISLQTVYDYRFFTKHLMSVQNMGYMALTYAKHVPGCYMACLWPVADRNKLNYVEQIISDAFRVVYSQDVFLTYQGLRNFMIQTYATNDWAGTLDDKYRGIDEKVNACYKKNRPIRTFLFMADSLDEVVNIKAKIRDVFKIENHSVHITDCDSETQSMTELLYNPNSVFFLNHSDTYKYVMAHKHIYSLRKRIEESNLNPARFIIDSSAVMEVCGLRQAKDVDFLTDYEIGESKILLNSENLDEHSSQLRYHSISVKDMLYNPQNYFYYDGMKFLTIQRVKEMKVCRNEKKDKRDVRLCNKYLKSFVYIPKPYRMKVLEKMRRYQIKKNRYGLGTTDYPEFIKITIKDILYKAYRRVTFH